MTPGPVALVVATALHGLVAGGAIYLSRPSRAPFYRPFAWLFAGSLVTEIVRWMNRELVLRDLPRPLQGWHRVPGHLEQALALGWPAAVVAVVWWAFRPRTVSSLRLIIPGIAWAIMVGYLVTHYPEIRGERLADFYRRVSVWEVRALGTIALLAFFRTPTWPLVGDRTAMLLTMGEFARFAGALGHGRSVISDADLDTVVYCLLYMAVAVVLGLDLCRRPRAIGSPTAS